jgi:hypothetical protein
MTRKALKSKDDGQHKALCGGDRALSTLLMHICHICQNSVLVNAAAVGQDFWL